MEGRVSRNRVIKRIKQNILKQFMKLSCSRIIPLFAAIIANATLYADVEPLSAKIDAYIISADSDAGETLRLADAANPGDVILYRAVFENTSDAPLESVQPVVPVPVAMTYIDDSAKPRPAEASLDGVNFQAFPILGANGEPVAPEEYRAFRWNAASLQPGVPFTVELRARLAR